MPVEIPGYYFDAEKNKYFKIERAQTAPSSASWSAEEVKKRKKAEKVKNEEHKRRELVKRHIKRWKGSGDVRLGREIGTLRGGEDVGDGMVNAFAGGLVDKGGLLFVPSFARERFRNMSCFYVGPMGVAYATLDEETLVGTHISTDENEAIPPATGRQGRGPGLRTEMIRCPQMSSVKYHEPSHTILLTSREPDHSCGLYFFSPPVSEGRWLLGETNHYQRLSIRHRMRDEWLVHQSTPAPASSPLLCVIGTNAGILRVRSNETMAWISSHSGEGQQQPREVFDQDFQMGNHNVLLAGGRQPRLWMTDLRTDAQWRFVKHASSITHLRSINEHQVLVAGLQNHMSLYDMRYWGKEYRPNGQRPLVEYKGYRNEAHVHTGWDVDVQLGMVAAAQDDGTVKLFSLRSGRMLEAKGLESVNKDTPIRALQWMRLEGERGTSLWVGDGPSLRKFSFGDI